VRKDERWKEYKGERKIATGGEEERGKERWRKGKRENTGHKL
jgi:hypothetical protein